jgi:hypothetical protein
LSRRDCRGQDVALVSLTGLASRSLSLISQPLNLRALYLSDWGVIPIFNRPEKRCWQSPKYLRFRKNSGRHEEQMKLGRISGEQSPDRADESIRSRPMCCKSFFGNGLCCVASAGRPREGSVRFWSMSSWTFTGVSPQNRPIPRHAPFSGHSLATPGEPPLKGLLIFEPVLTDSATKPYDGLPVRRETPANPTDGKSVGR